MTKTGKALAGIGAALVVGGGIYLAVNRSGGVEPNCYVDQSGTVLHVNHGLAGRTTDTGSGAHGTGMYGDDGIKYNFFIQCPTSGPELRFQRPQASAGPLVIAWWEWYWTNPSAKWNRCYVLPTGIKPGYPPPPKTECVPTYLCKTMPAPAVGTFAPRVFLCDAPVTPGVTVAPPIVTAPPNCPTARPCNCTTPGQVTGVPTRGTPTQPPAALTPTRAPRPTRVALYRPCTLGDPDGNGWPDLVCPKALLDRRGMAYIEAR